MAPIVHCVRHAQAYHNINPANNVLLDPVLTPYGRTQCDALSVAFPHHSNISLIFASPLRRTLDTARLAFRPALDNGKCSRHIIALPHAQETSDYPSDTGSDAAVLKRWCDENAWPVDLSLVQEGWNVKSPTGKWAPSSEAISARAREARRFIREKVREVQRTTGQDEVEVVLVTHGGYLNYFTEDWEGSDLYDAWIQGLLGTNDYSVSLPGTSWENTETRAYNFDTLSDSEDPNAGLTETPESRQSRGKSGPPLGREVQVELFNAAMHGSEDQGMQNPDKIGSTAVEVQGEEPAVGVDAEKVSSHIKVAA